MYCQSSEELNGFVNEERTVAKNGEAADYIPALGKENPNDLSIAIPAKSGVSRGIMGAVPEKIGIGIFGPALDEKGNSIAGMKLLELLSNRYSWSMFRTVPLFFH